MSLEWLVAGIGECGASSEGKGEGVDLWISTGGVRDRRARLRIGGACGRGDGTPPDKEFSLGDMGTCVTKKSRGSSYTPGRRLVF